MVMEKKGGRKCIVVYVKSVFWISDLFITWSKFSDLAIHKLFLTLQSLESILLDVIVNYITEGWIYMTPRFSTISQDSEHTVNPLLNGSALRIQVRQSPYILSSQHCPYYHRQWGHW